MMCASGELSRFTQGKHAWDLFTRAPGAPVIVEAKLSHCDHLHAVRTPP